MTAAQHYISTSARKNANNSKSYHSLPLKSKKQLQHSRVSSSHGHRPNRRSTLVPLLLLFTLLVGMVAAQAAFEPALKNISLEDVYYYVGCYTERHDLMKESVYAKTPQTCIQMCEHQSYSYAILHNEYCFCSSTVNENERQDEQLCNIRCLANKAQYCGGMGMHSYYSTMLGKSPAPNHLRVTNATENSLLVSWDSYEPQRVYVAGGAEAPLESGPKISKFVIKLYQIRTYSALPFYGSPEFTVQSSSTKFEIPNLLPATDYNISVSAVCASGLVCGSAFVVGSTVIGEPTPPPPQPKILARNDHTIQIEIPTLRNDNGPLTKVLVIVECVDDSLSQPFDTNLLGSWRKAQEDGLPYYIAAELDYDRPEDNRTRKFLVGDGKRYGQYVNYPLERQRNEDGGETDDNASHVHVSLGVVSSLNGITKTLYTRGSHDQHTDKGSLEEFTYATFESGQTSIIALTVTCVLFGTCLLLSVATYFYLRYKTCQTRAANGMNRLRNGHEMSMQRPIIERENSGFVVEDELPSAENFKQEMNSLLEGMNTSKRLPRSALRMNVNDVLVEGRYGELITGSIATDAQHAARECELHVLSLEDLSRENQAYLLRDMKTLSRLSAQAHEHILEFYGFSSSADWFYLVFAHEGISLKSKLVQSRMPANSSHRISLLSEEMVLQWIYELTSAMIYLSSSNAVHRQLCSHSVFVSGDSKLKLSVFGTPHGNGQQKVDLMRWLAPETMLYQHYSTKADVWSFACVAWECCALGGTPYAEIHVNQQILDTVRSGVRPAQPTYVYDDLYQLLLNCWQLEPSERISFEDIAFSIRQLMTSARHALSFERSAQSQYMANGSNHLPTYSPMLELQHQQQA